MKRLAILLVVLLVSPLGCKKALDKIGDQAKLEPDEKPQIIPKGTGDLSGGGGALGSVRKATARIANDVQLDQLYKSISAMELLEGGVPSADSIKKDVRQNKQLAGLIDEEVIILTNTNKKDGIWAYTKWPQRASEHYVITQSGRGQMSPAELEKALKAQGSTVNLEK
jgi:hypothetical protein